MFTNMTTYSLYVAGGSKQARNIIMHFTCPTTYATTLFPEAVA